MTKLARTLISSVLICFAYAGAAFAVQVNIDPDRYLGNWVLDDGAPRQGPASLDLAPGTHFIRVGGADDIFFDVFPNGWISVQNNAAATFDDGELKLKTTGVRVDPVHFTGNWRVSAGGTTDHSGVQWVVLVRGVRFYSFEVGATGGFFFHVEGDGTVIVENSIAASGGFKNLTLNNTERFLNP